MKGKGILSDAESIFKQMLSIGLFGLLFLIIFGNLSGNLGFADTTDTYTNVSGAWINTTVFTVSQASDENFTSWSVTVAHNASSGAVIGAGNYTVDSTAGTLVNASTTAWPSVNLTYVVTVDTESELNTERVIGNLTEGNVSFFSFSGTIFTLIAVTVLILVVLAVIRKVNTGMGGRSKTSGGYSG